MTVTPCVPEPRAAVDSILGLTGLPFDEEEKEGMVRIYATLRAGAASLRLADIRYGEPAMIYPALAASPEVLT